ncbi:hypothetical protein TanjilG_07043 [Lupinus angustifolius]|uniref:Uncharacterized protein n=1 Tax=Lupinus angustifolius TaxID=3871 RepID=A0A4P1QXK4_LUPAN|nr:hypothetical protein TanjilG_07043 [Lupinus angustifolius]
MQLIPNLFLKDRNFITIPSTPQNQNSKIHHQIQQKNIPKKVENPKPTPLKLTHTHLTKSHYKLN